MTALAATPRRIWRIDSLGAGVQSTAMYLLACEGRRPAPDACVFADTGGEPAYVYEHLDKLEEYGRQIGGPPIYRVSAGNLADDTFTKRSVSPPIWQKKPNGDIVPGGRWCTDKYKTRPINRFLKELAAVGRGEKQALVKVALGISTDEWMRAKTSREPWLTYEHPLLSVDQQREREPVSLAMSRADCIDYLTGLGWKDVPKSACVFCPFHSNELWAEVKELDPVGFGAAVEFDKRARHGTRNQDEDGITFWFHRSGVPLHEVELPEYVPGAGHGGVGCSPYSCPGDVIASQDG